MKAFLILAAVTLFALIVPAFGQRFFHNLEKRFARFANSRWAILWIVIAVMLISGALTLFFRLPQPRVHDEFSYLLQGDTFAHGRLTNPTHPLWRYFETFHVLQQPTYASKYQPGQGLFLGLGQVLWKPILGVWISTALAVAALFWMLRALFTPSWALVGATLTITNAQVLGWNWSFWGGSVPLLAGALVLGGMFRTLKNPTNGASIAIGIGAGLLAITRPFEGVVLCAVVGVVCIWSLLRRRDPRAFSKFLLPLICGAIPFIGFDLLYNYRVTGHALKPPYTVYEKNNSRSALFIWQSDPRNPRNHRAEINKFYDEEKKYADMQRSFWGFMYAVPPKIRLYDRYFLHGLLALMIIPALLLRKRVIWLCLGIFVLLYAITLGTSFWAQAHYSAPILPLFVALVVFGLRSMRTVWRLRLAARLLFVGFCLLGITIFAVRLHKEQKMQWQYNRADFLAQLERQPNKQLVLVRYSAQHNPRNEWIYNRADIDSAHVVFAPDGDAEYLKPLLEHFKGYDVTHIEPDRPMWGD